MRGGPCAAAIAVIACESTVYFGSDHTSGPLRLLWEFLFGPVTNDRWDLGTRHHPRSAATFIGYGIVGLAWLRAWRMTLRNSHFLFRAGMALMGTAAVATCDEWHQCYLPNRNGSPWDVLLDCCGAAAMLIMAWTAGRARSRMKLRENDFDNVNS